MRLGEVGSAFAMAKVSRMRRAFCRPLTPAQVEFSALFLDALADINGEIGKRVLRTRISYSVFKRPAFAVPPHQASQRAAGRARQGKLLDDRRPQTAGPAFCEDQLRSG